MYESPYDVGEGIRFSFSDLLLATWRLFRKRRFRICFQSAKYGNWGDRSCQAGEACRSPQE